MVRVAKFAFMGAIFIALVPAASAQDVYPSKAIRLVASFAPGGGVDTVARLFAEKMSGILGHPVIVLNQAGAAGGIAGKRVAAEDPDGYTVLVASNSMVIYSLMNPKMGLAVEKDLYAVASVAPQAVALVAAPNTNVRSLTDLIALSKTKPLSYATAGAGSVPHLVVELLAGTSPGTQMQHVPFQGAAPALAATMASQVDFASTTLPPAVALVTSEKLRGIAVTSPSRVAALPLIPTTAEAGFPTIVATAWNAFFVPPTTPKRVIEKLEAAILQVAAMPEIKEKLVTLGFEPTAEPGQKFRNEMHDEIKMWTGVLEAAKLIQQ